jgi:hypothetical protein
MKPRLYYLLIPILLGISNSANAQKYNTKFFSGGLGIEAGLPSGSAETMMTGAFGLDAHFGFRAGPGFITLIGGIVGYSGPGYDKGVDPSKDFNGAIIPVRVGYKYFIVRHLYVMADIGLQRHFLTHNDANGTRVNDMGTGLTYCPSIGVQFGVFEIAFKYEVNQVAGGNINDAAIRLGFDF